MESAFLIAGLGNPGTRYAGTRHNAGFDLADLLVESSGGAWKLEKKFHAEVAGISIDGIAVNVCKPLTFMNLSGDAVAPLAGFYKIPPEKTLVVIDDADLTLGKLRLRPEGSSGGHHGLESIEKRLGTRAFPRQKIGIGRVDQDRRDIADYVLGKFTEDERAVFEKALAQAVRQVRTWISSGIDEAIKQFNGTITQ